MSKTKSHKGLSKRVKLTASGKVKRSRSFGGHLMSSKTAKRRRHIRSSAIISGTAARDLRAALSK